MIQQRKQDKENLQASKDNKAKMIEMVSLLNTW